MLSYLYHPTTVTWSIHLVFAFILSVRVIMKRPSTGIALAWLLVINAIPIFGEVIYLLIGERGSAGHGERGSSNCALITPK